MADAALGRLEVVVGLGAGVPSDDDRDGLVGVGRLRDRGLRADQGRCKGERGERASEGLHVLSI